jgi:peptidoglycan/LPS O-acetylase OafA/YrhL
LPAPPAYRPDIDGLRAVAVTAVVAFHVVPGLLPGGFFGVDVFFVISGYLISALILQQLGEGRFTFGGFYVRRVKRLLPALVVVLAVTLAAGWWVLLPDEYRDLGRDAAGSAAFIANFVLWSEAGYFFQPDRTPLLHLWSLGVEEQFYLAWPAVLWLAWRRRWPLETIVLALTVLSFALNVHLTYADRSTAFFSPFPRAWEFLLGAWVACRAHPVVAGADRARARRVDDLRAIAGLALVLAPLVHVTGERAVPGWWAAGPTAGTALLIAAGPRAAINRTVLASRPFGALGLISNPLYLWHWPALSLTAMVENPPSMAGRVGAALASVVLAWMTWRGLEAPIRFRTSGVRIPAALCAALAGVALCGLLIAGDRIAARSAAFGLGPFLAAAAEAHGGPGPEAQAFTYGGHRFFRVGAADAAAALFIGDSKVNHYWPRVVDLIAASPERAVVFATCPGGPPIPGARARVPNRCGGLPEAAARFAESPRVDTVVVGAAWNNDFSGAYDMLADGERVPMLVDGPGGAMAFAALEAMLREFVRAGKATWLLLDSPSGRMLHPGNIVRRSLSGFTLDGRGVPSGDLAAAFGPLRERLVAVATRAGAGVLDPIPTLCDGAVCPALADGLPIYVDTGHLRPAYVRERVRFLDDATIGRAPGRR